MDFRGPTPTVFAPDRTSAAAGSGGVVAAGRQDQPEGIDRKRRGLRPRCEMVRPASFHDDAVAVQRGGNEGEGS